MLACRLIFCLTRLLQNTCVTWNADWQVHRRLTVVTKEKVNRWLLNRLPMLAVSTKNWQLSKREREREEERNQKWRQQQMMFPSVVLSGCRGKEEENIICWKYCRKKSWNEFFKNFHRKSSTFDDEHCFQLLRGLSVTIRRKEQNNFNSHCKSYETMPSVWSQGILCVTYMLIVICQTILVQLTKHWRSI